MQQDSPLAFDLPAVARKKVSIAFDGGMLSSDAGVLPAARCRAAAVLSITLAPALMVIFVRGRIVPEHKKPRGLRRLVCAKP